MSRIEADQCLFSKFEPFGRSGESATTPLLFVFEGVLIEEGVDDHRPGEVVVFLLAEGVEGFFEEDDSFLGGKLSGDAFVEVGEFFVFAAVLLEDGFGLVLSCFEIFGLVHEEERLERGVGALAAGDAGVSGGGVEDCHLGWSKAAFPKGVDGAALGGRVLVGDEFIGEGTGKGYAFPEAIGLWGFDAATTHFGVEDAGDVEELVADDFGVEADAGAAGKEAVFGVGFEVDRISGGGLLVGLSENYFLDEGFDIPTGFDEFEGEVVEEFWVTGPHALPAKVFRGFNNPSAEELLPEAIHGDAGGEGILLIDEPVGEVHAGGDFAGGFERGKKGGGVAGDDLAEASVVAPNPDVGGIEVFALTHDHGSTDLAEVGVALFLEGGDLFFCVVDLRLQVGLGSRIGIGLIGWRCGGGLLFLKRYDR